MGNGDIVVRLPDSHQALLAIDGATRWQDGTKATKKTATTKTTKTASTKTASTKTATKKTPSA